MSKRKLTESEIENILATIQPQRGIPVATATAIAEKIRGKIRKQIEDQEIYPKMIPELGKCILAMYENARVQSGESVGTIAAQSFGQFQTQSTLNSFHKAGLAEKTVVSGVPRFAELIGATKSPKGRACIIKFKSENDSIQSLRKMIGSSILEFKIKKLADNITMNLKKEPEPWYESFKILHNDDFEDMSTCVTIMFNKKYMYEYSITLKQIAQRIESVYSDLICVFSPNHLCQMDIFVDTESIELPENILSFITQDNMVPVYIEEVVIPKLEDLQVFGISGIANIFYCNETDPKTKIESWHLETEGSNFSDLLAHPHVDVENTMTNDIWEIYNTLGIEATRQCLIEEFGSIMSGINPCHSRLLADKMTYNGIITSISRYAMRAEGSGALSKASFEETLDNLLNAAVYGERECTDGVSASIICGKLGKFGTGVCELKVDMSKLTGIVFKGEVKEK
jgi:DNA-directed RNA polymerase beta' subunit